MATALGGRADWGRTFPNFSYHARDAVLCYGSYNGSMLMSGYIGEFEVIDDHRGGKVVIQLNGRLNKTGVISPRFNIAVDAIENWVALLLPARSFGKIILTTSAGIMDHEEARRKHVGGKILAYVY